MAPRPNSSRLARPRPVQIELFPIPLVIETLDPRLVGGEGTRVVGVYLVRARPGAPPHRVFNDQHGWYCEEHGAACDLVPPLRVALGVAEAAPDPVRPRPRR